MRFFQRTKHKYGIAPPDERIYDDVLYDSKLEVKRAIELDLLLRSGAITGWQRQVRFELGPDFATVVDFVVTNAKTTWVEEVKGFETPDFKRIKKLWRRYGPIPLLVYTYDPKKGTKWKIQEIPASILSSSPKSAAGE